MRDLIIISLVLAGSIAALRRPWIGVMVWTWLSIMNPHRMSWGIAYDAPLAAVAAGATLLGLLFTKDRSSPFKGAPTVLLLLFVVWVTLSWLFGLNPSKDYAQWNKVMKIYLMIFVGLALLHEKRHVLALAWVAAGSLALLGLKGGVFTILTGGNYRVWGPPGSFIADNNEFALSLVMTIPLLRFLQLQMQPIAARYAMTAVMALCAVAAVGTHSRGALVAIAAMSVMLWWRGRSRIVGGIAMVGVAVALLSFMPETWTSRMTTMSGGYEGDRSALGRVSAWWNAYGIAKDYVFGVGFDTARADLFARYSPYPEAVHAAHSIYFQVLGNHGFIGLFLFLAIFVTTYWSAGRLRREARASREAAWCDELGAMCQIALVGYAVGGAFLSLSYFDLPYNIMMLVVIARHWVAERGWTRDTQPAGRWSAMLGVAGSKA